MAMDWRIRAGSDWCAMTLETFIECHPLIGGDVAGEFIISSVGLSFWGGVDPATGLVIDQHHPLHGQSLNGKILAIPSGRGSCSGSGVMLESLLNKVAPAAVLFSEPEDIITLGVLVAQVLFDSAIPVYRIRSSDFEALHREALHREALNCETLPHEALGSNTASSGIDISITADLLRLSSNTLESLESKNSVTRHARANLKRSLLLSDSDQRLLDGKEGKAVQLAMQIVVRMAELQGAEQLIDVTQAHIDACVYNGASSLMFAERLVSLGGVVRVPTTLNSLSVDKRRWCEQGIDCEFGEAASALGDAYMAMGATLSYTCAPYLLDSTPAYGEQIVWAESNAVTFANSIIGARTQKYPDFLDICIALTGRAPLTGTHLDSGRQPSLRIHVAIEGATDALNSRENLEAAISPQSLDDSFWPLLGYHVGTIAGNDIPLITGLEVLEPTLDDHKAFSAAFATTSSVPMYHIVGHTPEAESALKAMDITSDVGPSIINATDLSKSWSALNRTVEDQVDLVCLGNPHFSLTECAALADLCFDRVKHPRVGVIVTLGRDVYNHAAASGYIENLERFGVQFVNDTCWCMIDEPLMTPGAKILITNSGKYAHYGPGLVNRPVLFGGLVDCVNAACTGVYKGLFPEWLARANSPDLAG